MFFWLRRIPAETRIVVLVVFVALFQAILLSLFGLRAIRNEREDVAESLSERAEEFLLEDVAVRCEAGLIAQADLTCRSAFDRHDPDWQRHGAGMFVDVEVEVGRREDAILVSEAAIVYDRKGTYVWRIGADDRAQRVSVGLGLRSAGRVHVERGLAPGDVVVVAGTHKLKEGSRIRRAQTEPSTQARERREHEPAIGGGT